MYENFLNKIKDVKKTNPAALVVLVLVGAIFGLLMILLVDVWFLGSLAAVFRGIGIWLLGTSLLAGAAQKAAVPYAFDGVGWFLHHPFTTAWAWLTKPATALSSPGIRTVWLILNVLIAMAALIIWVAVKFQASKNAKDQDRDIRKVRFKKVDFDVLREIERTPSGQVFLGLNDQRRPVRATWQEMTEHTHVMGGSGTGKTSFAVIPICLQAIRHGLPVVAIDFKGDKQAVQLLAKETKKAGKKFYMFSLHPQVNSNSYNPIFSGSALAKGDRVLIGLDLVFDGPAKFYTYSQKSMFLSLIRHFERHNSICTLKDIHDALKSSDLIEEITGEKVNPGHLKGLVAALDMYCDFKQVNTHEPDICLDKIMANGDVVYFDLRSAVGRELSSTLGKMIAMDLEVHAAFRTEHDIITVVAIDEFQNMACEAFKNIISKVRSANYAFILSNQAPSDLRSVSNDFLSTVGTNTRTKIVFNVDDPYDVENYAKRSGNVLISVESESQSKSRPAGQAIGGQNTEGKSVQEQEKSMINANQLLLLPFKKSAIYRRSELAVFANHGHMITKDEKDRLIREPYPEPVHIFKQGVKTASDEIERMKMIIIERKKQEKQNKKQTQDQSRQQPERPENSGVETEDFDM